MEPEPQELENNELQKGKIGFPFDPLNSEHDLDKMPIGRPIGTGVPEPGDAFKKIKEKNLKKVPGKTKKVD